MARYRNSYRDEIETPVEDDIDEQVVDTPPVNAEDANWKDRYGNLRRYSQEKETELNQKLAEKDRQIAELSKQPMKLPKTEEEVAEWASKYPDVAAIIRTLAIKEAQALNAGVEEKLREVDEMKKAAKMQAALQKILNVHPDFLDIRADDAFKHWATKEAPKWVYQGLYENDEDHQVVIDAVDLYKMKKQIKSKESAPAKVDPVGAASTVRPGGSAAPKATSDEPKWSDSRVAKLSHREYEKYEDEIMEAMHTGKYVYDLSGGAR